MLAESVLLLGLCILAVLRRRGAAGVRLTCCFCEIGSLGPTCQLLRANSHFSSFLFEELHIQKVDVQDNMSNVSEERSTRQQDIKKGLQFIEYGSVFLFLYILMLIRPYVQDGWGSPFKQYQRRKIENLHFSSEYLLASTWKWRADLKSRQHPALFLSRADWRWEGVPFQPLRKNQH